MAPMLQELRGLRILVVEDNFLVAEVLRDLLEEKGCQVMGPAPRVSVALQLCKDEVLDGALLDINLGGQSCFPIATYLLERGVPFFFLSGYDDSTMIPAPLRHIPRLAKPFDRVEVARTAARHFAHADR
jgi:DNA-binding response OmpR family regulator